MNMEKQIAKAVHRLGNSYAVVLAPALVKQLGLDTPLTFLTQEVQPDGSIIMRPMNLAERKGAPATTGAISPGVEDNGEYKQLR
jgi:antitoxin component of MazEF toxin-antitoxin module